jgi:hypothetical protein
MSLHFLLLSLSAGLTLLALLPYAIGIVAGRVRPNIASWLIWTALTAIATAAELMTGEITAAVITLAATIATGMVVLLGLRYGYTAFGRLEWFCLVGGGVGLLGWLLLNNASFAVVITVSVDLIGGIPTVLHAWQKPGEEEWRTFALSALGAACGIAALNTFTWISLPYPGYLFAMNLFLAIVIMVRRYSI